MASASKEESLRIQCEELAAELVDLRAEVLRLRACSAEQGEQYAAAVLGFASELRTVAERQREACVDELSRCLGLLHKILPEYGVGLVKICLEIRSQVLATPLVTDAKADGGTP